MKQEIMIHSRVKKKEKLQTIPEEVQALDLSQKF
jgi:hypothetical protein